MNHNEMSAAQCADWLAEKDGCRVVCKGMIEEGWIDANGNEVTHPYKLTLDAAAGALREPWRLNCLEIDSVGRTRATIHRADPVAWEHVIGPDRMTAEYRAAVVARMEDER